MTLRKQTYLAPAAGSGKPEPTFSFYYADDGTLVVHVDTMQIPENEKGPIVRLYLNDESVFENPPYPGIGAR